MLGSECTRFPRKTDQPFFFIHTPLNVVSYLIVKDLKLNPAHLVSAYSKQQRYGNKHKNSPQSTKNVKKI